MSKEQTKDEFLDEYYNNHKCCPQCVELDCETSLNMHNFDFATLDKEKYKDETECICTMCGNKHTRHDRVTDHFPI
jgi:hypothetical protein